MAFAILSVSEDNHRPKSMLFMLIETNRHLPRRLSLMKL
jgi:hypothetical protein